MSHTIISANLKFELGGFVRTIENTGGFPIIKYTASAEHVAQLKVLYSDKYTATSNSVLNHIVTLPAGSEILVVGETIHFPAGVMVGPAPTPLLNYLPKSPLP